MREDLWGQPVDWLQRVPERWDQPQSIACSYVETVDLCSPPGSVTVTFIGARTG